MGYYGLSKAERIKNNADFQAAFKSGRKIVTPCFVLYCAPNNLSYNRVGVVASRKTGNAVVRNRLKRLFREVYRLNKNLLRSGYDLVLVARTGMLKLTLSGLEPLLRSSFAQAGIIKAGAGD